ncbi:MAG: YgiT-type zinc finger protein [Methanosarcinales archaeon]
MLVTNLKGHKCPRCGEVYYYADSVGVLGVILMGFKKF